MRDLALLLASTPDYFRFVHGLSVNVSVPRAMGVGSHNREMGRNDASGCRATQFDGLIRIYGTPL